MHMCILGMEHPSSVLDFLNSSYFRKLHPYRSWHLRISHEILCSRVTEVAIRIAKIKRRLARPIHVQPKKSSLVEPGSARQAVVVACVIIMHHRNERTSAIMKELATD